MNFRFILPAILCLPISLAAVAQTKLNLPLNAAEMRKYMSDFDNACPGCAVVTNVRQLQQNDTDADAGSEPSQRDVLGGSVYIKPIFSTGGDAAKSQGNTATGKWRITVLYDNGSYAVFDQLLKPELMKGDPVQVVAGHVERR
jgi:hypothetical protein